ncbi:MAG TPA: ribosome-associated translation inhibitor RaiA [Candidatus Saccharimonadales bacterium]|nr:ribosome-associated translation inhibitor RaiA [Candidatus Saccharimonadales bacterium]
MFERYEVQGIHTAIDDRLRAHIDRKLGGLDRYIARQNRDAAHLEVHLKETGKKGNAQSRCEVTLHLPHQNIIIKESAVNLYAAVDIVEAKLKQQLQKYKELHGSGKQRRHMFNRFRRRGR